MRTWKGVPYLLGNGFDAVEVKSLSSRIDFMTVAYQFTYLHCSYTVKPPNKGHIGDGSVVPCREVVLFSEVFF